MLTVAEQIREGRLVCPLTRQRLSVRDDRLVTEDGRQSYPRVGGVPILISDARRQASYRQQAGGSMHAEYLAPKTSRVRESLRALIQPRNDYRAAGAQKAFQAVTEHQPARSLCLSVGGGPTRPHPSLTNLNIDLFPNVDVVGDGYALPYADEAVDTVHCEAVLEHLAEPARALQEMRRTLRSGGLGYFVTPFLQGYHAYPNHYQNFTLEGHNHLLEKNGFRVLDSGACVGPTFAILDLCSLYLRHHVPGRIPSRLAYAVFLLLTRPLRPLDRRLNQTPQASVLASTVYALVEKR